MRRGRSIVEGAEPFVPGHLQISVIHLKIPVMHLMVERPERQPPPVLDQKIFVSRMRRRGGQRLVLHVKQDMRWT